MYDLTRFGMFASALWKQFTSGCNFCTKEQIEERLEICKGCDKFTGSKCLECGCGMGGGRSLLNKLSYPHEVCPLGKWGAVSLETVHGIKYDQVQ